MQAAVTDAAMQCSLTVSSAGSHRAAASLITTAIGTHVSGN
jgi:hypothetical protein